MTKAKKLRLIKDIVRYVDNDIYKGLFVNPEEPEFAEEQIEDLLNIVDNFVDK